MAKLSGRDWWVANQGRFPNSSDVDDLRAGFAEDVKSFIRTLRAAGANVRVRSTRRDARRAYLMHYSWRIANGDIDAADVPKKVGVEIQWDHGDAKASRKAARQMVSLFGLAYRPSLRSNHIRGLAIDMSVRWRRDILLGPLPGGAFQGIVGGPRNGARNRELHAVGERFGVRKLLSDPPHWSRNGR